MDRKEDGTEFHNLSLAAQFGMIIIPLYLFLPWQAVTFFLVAIFAVFGPKMFDKES